MRRTKTACNPTVATQICPYKETTEQRGSSRLLGGRYLCAWRLCRVGLSVHHQLLASSIPALEMLMTKVIGAAALGVALLVESPRQPTPRRARAQYSYLDRPGTTSETTLEGTRPACRAAMATTIARASLRSFAQRRTISNWRCPVTTANACKDLAGSLCQCLFARPS